MDLNVYNGLSTPKIKTWERLRHCIPFNLTASDNKEIILFVLIGNLSGVQLWLAKQEKVYFYITNAINDSVRL
jgi:hypothetical protein